MKKLIGLFLILFLSSTVLIAQENRTARRGADEGYAGADDLRTEAG